MLGFLRRLRLGDRRVYDVPEWVSAAGADWPDSILDAVVTDRFFAKQGRSISRWTRGPLVVYLKRHYRLPRWHGILAALWPSANWSPGWQEHVHLQIAERLGVPVPRVVAAAEYIRPGGQLQSMLAVEELSGMIPLHEAIPLAARRLAPADFAKWKRGLIAEMVRLTRLLHDDAWFHKDLYLCHFYIPDADTIRPPIDWIGRVHMIDFHRLARHPITRTWWTAKDLGQLLYSSDVDGVSARDRVRFWKLYSGRKTPIRSLVRRIALIRARNHAQHNQRRPQLPAKAA